MKSATVLASVLVALAAFATVQQVTIPTTYAAVGIQNCVTSSSVWDDTDIVHILRFHGNKVSLGWMDQGSTSLQCQGDAGANGQEVTIAQTGQVSGVSGGILTGPTHIVIEFTSLGLKAAVEGHVRGTASCTASECVLQLDIQATGAHARLRGHETLTFHRGTKTVDIQSDPLQLQFQ